MRGALDPDTFFELFLADADGPGDRGRPVPKPAEQWRAWWRETTTLNPIAELAARTGFVLTTRAVAELGITRLRVRTEVRRGRWVQAGRGMLAPVDVRRDLPRHGAKEVAARRRHALVAAASSRARRD